MDLDLTSDGAFPGPALLEPFVKFNLEAKLNRLELLPNTTGEEGWRLAERVRQGGHGIPEDVIRRRFAAGLHNLERAYKSAVDAWAKYDSVGESPSLLEWGENQ